MESASISASVDAENEAASAATEGKRKAGAPAGNVNSMRHGLYSAKPDRWLSPFGNRMVNLFRRKLEELIAEREEGCITVYHAALIQTATESARLAASNRELLAAALSSGPLKIEQRLAIDRDYAMHLDRRDRKLKELGLDVSDVAGDGLGLPPGYEPPAV